MDESIFTPDQINELTKISKLPEEEQKNILPEFLKKLTSEQLSYLRGQQRECPYCLISENKIKAKKIYEDNEVVAVLEIHPVSLGHAIIFPKKHFSVLAQMHDVSHIFNVANKVSSLLFDVLKAKGTNILVSNGQLAGQSIPHVIINVIPRFEEDNINLNFERKQVTEEELNSLLSKLREKPIFMENKQAIEKVIKEEIKEVKEGKKDNKTETKQMKSFRLP